MTSCLTWITRGFSTSAVRLEFSIYEVLLRRLEITFGFADTALQWFRSYLAGRSQRVLLNGSFSEDFSLPHGVPQGSCLGPLRFTIYASQMYTQTTTSIYIYLI